MKLRDYQIAAVEHLQTNPRAGLFLDMGLGKTATVLRAITPDHLPVLVVAPKRVASHVWPAEQVKWRPDLSLTLVAGTPAKREEALQWGLLLSDVVVISQEFLGEVPAGHFRTVVIDELSGYKTRKTARWKAARTICKTADYVWGLTGTPAPNGLLNLWGQLYLLDSGERLGTGITHYRDRYFNPGMRLPNGVIANWTLKPGAQEAIHEKIKDICLSIGSEGRLHLPEVTYNQIEVPLDPGSRKHYAALDADLTTSLDILGEEQMVSAGNAAALFGRLSQITAGFLYPDVDDPDGVQVNLHEAKIDALREVVEGTGSPVLAFYRFREGEAERISKAFPQSRRIDGPGDPIADWNAGKVPLLLAHPASAGHGLNLQDGGHTIVWTSPTWDLEHWEQGNGRLIRSGQKNPVVVHTLVSPGTVDIPMVRRIETKASVQDALMEYLALSE